MADAFVCPQCGSGEELAGEPGACARCSVTPAAKQRTFVDRLIEVSGMGGILIVAIFFLLPGTSPAEGAAKKSRCSNNLKQIGLALLNYHVRYGSYPPAYIADPNGRPMHSWRVLILPFLERSDLYAQYDFAQPWNSEHNVKLAAQMPREFHCPGSHKEPTDKTSYVAANGPGYFFDRDHCRRESEVRDGLSNSIAVLDDARRELVWLDPTDGVTVVDVKEKVDGKAHPKGMNVLWADGSVQFLTSKIELEKFEKLLTVSGGEPLPTEAIDRSSAWWYPHARSTASSKQPNPEL